MQIQLAFIRSYFQHTKALLKTSEKERKHTEWKFDILEERFKHVSSAFSHLSNSNRTSGLTTKHRML